MSTTVLTPVSRPEEAQQLTQLTQAIEATSFELIELPVALVSRQLGDAPAVIGRNGQRRYRYGVCKVPSRKQVQELRGRYPRPVLTLDEFARAAPGQYARLWRADQGFVGATRAGGDWSFPRPVKAKRAPRQLWSPADLDRLIKAHDQGGLNAAYAALPERSRASIRTQLCRIRLADRSPNALWSAYEDTVLRTQYPLLGADAVLRTLPSKTMDEVRLRVKELNLRRAPNTHRNPWSDEDRDRLTRMVEEGATFRDLMAAFPNRTPCGLEGCLGLWGLTLKNTPGHRERRRWTPEEDALLRALIRQGVSTNEAVRLLPDRVPSAILQRMRKLRRNDEATTEKAA